MESTLNVTLIWVFTWTYVKWLNLGRGLPFHMAVNHCMRVASYSAKRWHLESGSSILSFFSLSCGCKEGARHVGTYFWLWTWLGERVIAITEQLCENMAASLWVQVTTAVYCVFAAKNCLVEVQELFILERNCWELKWEGIGINYTLVTHFHTF